MDKSTGRRPLTIGCIHSNHEVYIYILWEAIFIDYAFVLRAQGEEKLKI